MTSAIMNALACTCGRVLHALACIFLYFCLFPLYSIFYFFIFKKNFLQSLWLMNSIILTDYLAASRVIEGTSISEFSNGDRFDMNLISICLTII